jgi:hypothetical protein
VIELIGQRHLLDGARIASEADEPRVKQRDVALELVGRVLFRIDGDEQRLDRGVSRTEPVDRRWLAGAFAGRRRGRRRRSGALAASAKERSATELWTATFV